MCSVPKRWDGFPTALLAFVAGGKGYRLRISAPGPSEHQVVTLNSVAGVVELSSISNPSQRWNQAMGSLTLNADATSGTIDANLLRDVNGAAPVHISGRWACGAALPLPGFDAAAPCASFYALNHLNDADVARMKASACNPESLVFSGDIRGQVDHAITDMQGVVDGARKAVLDMTTVAESNETTAKDADKVEQEVEKAKADRQTAKQERENAKKADKAKLKATKSQRSGKGDSTGTAQVRDSNEDRD